MPTGAAYRAMYGGMPGVPPTDYALARCIILWGVNPSATSIHLVPHVRAAQAAGAFVAVIDPRRTPLARTADLHLAPRPGTDVVLALAMIDALHRRGAADATQVSGLDRLAQAAAEWPVHRAAAECDVPAADIERLVEAYAAASPAVLRCGWGLERNHNGGQAARAILALPAVAGKFGVRGGGVTMSLSRAYPVERRAAAAARPRARAASRRSTWCSSAACSPSRCSPPVQALFVYNANPVAMTPDQNRIIAGLSRDDLFTVVHEQVMTDTARFADVLLPATTIFEQTELHRSYGHYVTQYSEPVIAPLGESLTNPQVFARLGRAMGFAEAAATAEEPELLADALDADLLATVRSRPRRARCAFRGGTEDVVQFGTVFPGTPSGTVELCPPALGAGHLPPGRRRPAVSCC